VPRVLVSLRTDFEVRMALAPPLSASAIRSLSRGLPLRRFFRLVSQIDRVGLSSR
jgi:hypothetical protein